ncbi:MAG: HD domain-containing protein [Dehalococcoidia bacterium]|nr:HD domain-containing protein [Dehalococcoidia bacterium]
MTADLQQQLRAIQHEMESRPEGLQRHVQRVADEAKELAGYWDVDPERVELASWAHDLFRHLEPEDQLKKATEVGLGVSRDDRVDPIVLHGPIAAKVIRDSFGVTDEETLEAVSSHTLGLPEMSMVGQGHPARRQVRTQQARKEARAQAHPQARPPRPRPGNPLLVRLFLVHLCRHRRVLPPGALERARNVGPRTPRRATHARPRPARHLRPRPQDVA